MLGVVALVVVLLVLLVMLTRGPGGHGPGRHAPPVEQGSPGTVRGAYLVMEPAARFVLIPLAVASLLTGIVQSIGTTWGLFRHYWVLFKLLITLFATIILLIYMDTFSHMAAIAADPTADLDAVRNGSPALHAVLALVVLLVATVLAVYKPRGLTPYGWRKHHEHREV